MNTSLNSKHTTWKFFGFLSLLVALSFTLDVQADDEAESESLKIAAVKHDGPVDFQQEILPLLQKKCLACHNATEAESDLVLESPQSILKGGGEGPSVVPGKGFESLLLQAAAHQVEPFMPPEDNEVGAKDFTPEELGLLKLWIDQGAKGEVIGSGGPVKWQPLPPGVNPIYAVAVSPHGDFVAAGRANQIFLYQVATKSLVGRLSDPALLTQGTYKNPGVAHLDLVQSLAFSPNGNLMASGGYRTVKLWQRQENRLQKEISAAAGASSSLAVSNDGKTLAIGYSDGSIKLIDPVGGKEANLLQGHTAAVSGLSFSADGKSLVSGSQDKTISLWNVADGKQTGKIESPVAVTAVALIADGKQIIAGGEDNMIRSWSLPEVEQTQQPAQLIKELTGHTGPISSLAAVATKTHVLSGSQDGTVRLWDVASGKQIRQMNHGGPVTAVAADLQGKRFASSGTNKVAKIWNAGDGKQIAELRGDRRAKVHVDDINRAITLAKQQVANVKKDLRESQKRKKQEEDNTKKSEETLKKAKEEAKKKTEAVKKPLADKAAADKSLAEIKPQLAKAETEKKAVDESIVKSTEALKKLSAEKEKNDKIAVQTAAEAKKLAKKLAEIQILAQAAEAKSNKTTQVKANLDKAFAEATASKTLADKKKADIEKNLQVVQKKFKEVEALVKKTTAPAEKATSAKKTADRNLQASTRALERAKLATEKATAAIPPAEKSVKQRDEELKQQQEALKNAQKSFAETEKPFRSLSFSPNGQQLATAGEDRLLHTWNAETGVAIDVYAQHEATIIAVAFADDTTLVSISENQKVSLWDNQPRWQLLRTIGNPDSSEQFVDRVTALHFSPDSNLLATGGGEPSRNGELKIWNVQHGTLVMEVKDAHSDTIFGLEFSPDGTHLASSGADRFMKVFDAASGKFVKAFEGHTHHVLGVSWRADGRVLASCGADNVVKVWDFLTGDQKKTIPGFKKEVTAIQYLGTEDKFVVSAGDKSVTSKTSAGGGGSNFSGTTDFMYSVRNSLDGKTVVAGGQDSVLRVWTDKGKTIVNFDAPQPPAKDNSSDNKQASK